MHTSDGDCSPRDHDQQEEQPPSYSDSPALGIEDRHSTGQGFSIVKKTAKDQAVSTSAAEDKGGGDGAIRTTRHDGFLSGGPSVVEIPREAAPEVPAPVSEQNCT